jgi:tetraacyldisaccharide 4'-kinase
VLVTRTDAADSFPAIQAAVRERNERAQIFRASIEPECWVEHRTGKRYEPCKPPFERAGAFCGLGNPDSFRKTLAAIRVEPVDWVEFPDHHHYRPHELQRLANQFEARGAAAVVTTEKDAVNLGESAADLLKPLELYWLKIRMTIDRESEFVDYVLKRISAS